MTVWKRRIPRTTALVALLAAAGCSDSVAPKENKPPLIRDIIVSPESVVFGGKTRVTSLASDPDGDDITYHWTATGGSFDSPAAPTVFWTAPGVFGDFTVTLEVSDGILSAVDSVHIAVGQGSLYVTSDPPGAFLSLDGTQTGNRTPYLFDPLARGPHGVLITSTEWKYENDVINLELANGAADTIRFRTAPASVEVLNLGRSDFEEIGGMTYLQSGVGLVYAARSTELGRGIYSSAISPATGAPNAVLLTDDVAINEPLAIYSTDSLLVYTDSRGRLVAAEIVNENKDGVIDRLQGARVWGDLGAYGVTTAQPDLIAISLTPSSQPAVAPIFQGTASTISPPNFVQATTTFGRQPSWDPSGFRIAYQYQGQILWVFAGAGLNSPDTLSTEGYCQLPAWSPWGPHHVAYAQGTDELNAYEVRLQLATSLNWVTVFSGLFDVRDLAWSPAQRRLAISQNPGSGQIVLLYNLPIP